MTDKWQVIAESLMQHRKMDGTAVADSERAIAAALRAAFNEGVEAAAKKSCAHCRDGLPVDWIENASWKSWMHGSWQCYASKIRDLKEPTP